MKINFNPMSNNINGRQKVLDEKLLRLKKLSREFESFFLKEVISAMRSSVPENGLLNGGNAEKIYRSMIDDQWAAQMAERGDTGIARSIYKSLSKAYLDSQNSEGNRK